MDENIEAIYGLTPMQEGMLFHKYADSKDTSYHIQSSFWFKDNLDMSLVRQALELLVEKHEVFRTAFIIPKATGVPWQVLLKKRKIELNETNAAGTAEELVIEKTKKEDLMRGFQLQEDCLFRLQILHFGMKKHLFLFSFHHIIMDGWCLSIVFQDFIGFYRALGKGRNFKELEKLIEAEKRNTCSYKEYINWLNQKDKGEGLAYWEALLSDYRENAGITPLKKPDIASDDQMKLAEVSLSKQITDKLKSHAKNYQVTLNIIAEAAWGILLMKYNYTKDAVYGKVVSGRNVPLQGIHEKVGLFINAVPLRVRYNPEDKIRELCLALKEQGIKGDNYDFCPLSEIQTLTEQGLELIKTMFVYENYYANEDAAEEEDQFLIEFEASREQTNYPVSISFAMEGEQLGFKIMYNSNEFVPQEMKNYAGWLKNILIYIALNPEALISDVEMITEGEKKKIFEEFNQKSAAYNPEESIIHLFEEQVKRTPDNIALTHGVQRITYDDFNKRVNSIAWKLKEMKVEKGDYIGVIANRSIGTMAALYGILKAGGAYVPIDPSYPYERIQYILTDCRPKLLIVDTPMDFLGYPYLDITQEEVWEGNTDNLDNQTGPCDLAYCIYTSGTTGKPKGVMLEHKGVVNLKNYFTGILNITEKDSILQFANLVFDASVWEMTMAFLTGAKLVMPTEEERKNNDSFLKLADRESISVATLPPNFYANLEGFHPRLLITAGSETSRDIVKKALERGEYINAYGPTEFTVAATHWKYDKGSKIPERIPIGKQILNTEIFILDGLNLCGIGVPGELCMAGIGMARGYLNKPDLTEEKFIKNPYGEGNLYRSGDLARWLPDGNIEYLGRLDEQVKIRGYRIELGEIESLLRKMEDIADAAVIAKKDRAGDNAIYAYIVSKDSQMAEKAKIELRKFLPDYMIPSFFLSLEEIPVNKSGKLDKNALPDIEMESKKEYLPPQNETEEKISRMFKEVLKLKSISMDESFFDIGGDSLKAMKLVTKLKAEGFEISIQDIFHFKDIRSLYQNCSREHGKTDYGESVLKIPSFVKMEEMLAFLKEVKVKFSTGITKEKTEKRFSLSPMQKLSINKGILKSGIVINFNYEIEPEKLTEVLKNLINSQELLRSTLTKDDKGYTMNVKSTIDFTDIPVFDISDAPIKVRTDFEAYIKNAMFEEQYWEIEKSEEKLLYCIIAVRCAPDNWKLYVPVSHLIFDGMSGEILRNSIVRGGYSRENELEDTSSFSAYVNELKIGPVGISEEDIINDFKLRHFRNHLIRINSESRNNFINTALVLRINSSGELSEKQIWSVCYKLFIKLVCNNTEMEEVSFGVLFADRKKKRKNYVNTIGEFLDIIPASDSPYSEEDYDSFDRLLNKTIDRHINFTSFIYDENLRMKFKEISETFIPIDNRETLFPVFNFSGLFDSEYYAGVAKNLHEKKEVNFVVDMTSNKQEILINGFCKDGEENSLKEDLQIYLDELLLNNKFLES